MSKEVVFVDEFDGVITIEEDVGIRDNVYHTVLDWFVNNRCFSGEELYQSDYAQINGLELLADLADIVFNFEYSQGEEDD